MADRPYIFRRMFTSLDGKITGSFFDAPGTDEADASSNSPSVFMSAVSDNPDPVAFKLKDVQTVADTVWLRYTVANAH